MSAPEGCHASPLTSGFKLTEAQCGPLAHGWADQRWTLARVKTVIGRLFHVSYTVEGTWRLLRRYGWSWQQPTRRAIERDDDAVELWKREVWPRVRGCFIPLFHPGLRDWGWFMRRAMLGWIRR